jgi:hypothetical protein
VSEWQAARYFDGEPRGFRFEIPGVLLSGPTTEEYVVTEHRWHVTYRAAGQEWTGKADTQHGAYLDLIAQRLDTRDE